MPFRFVYPVASVAWTILVFYLCLVPSTGIPTIPWLAHPLTDKLVHVLLYSVLCTLYWLPYRKLSIHPKKKIVFLVATICLAIGIIIELLQSSMNLGRSFEIADIFANAIASFTVALVIYRISA